MEILLLGQHIIKNLKLNKVVVVVRFWSIGFHFNYNRRTYSLCLDYS